MPKRQTYQPEDVLARLIGDILHRADAAAEERQQHEAGRHKYAGQWHNANGRALEAGAIAALIARVRDDPDAYMRGGKRK